jgi:hypothetical protein
MSARTDAILPAGEPQARAPGSEILAAWTSGWKIALGMPSILMLKWAVNLTFAVAAVLPVALLLANHLGNSVVGEQAFESMGTDIAAEFALAAWPQLRLAALASAPTALGYLLVNLYLTGGILHRLRAGLRKPWAEFFAACNGNFSLLIRVGLLTLVLAALVLGLPYYGLARLVEILTEDAAGPQPLFYLTWLQWALLLLLGSWVARVYDYARIAAFLQPGGSARRAFLRALAFTLRRGTKTLVLWLLLVVPAPALAALLATTSVANGVETTGAMSASVALGQALLLLRILGSFAALGGQMRFMLRFQRP